MTNTHTWTSLGKYLDKEIWIKFRGESPKVERLTLDILKLIKDADFYFEYCYPILKTAKDLTEGEINEFNAIFEIFKNYISRVSIMYKIFGAYRLVRGLSKINMYCETDKSSPTGYKSLLDGLPCKSWSEVFNDIS